MLFWQIQKILLIKKYFFIPLISLNYLMLSKECWLAAQSFLSYFFQSLLNDDLLPITCFSSLNYVPYRHCWRLCQGVSIFLDSSSPYAYCLRWVVLLLVINFLYKRIKRAQWIKCNNQITQKSVKSYLFVASFSYRIEN